MAVNTPMYMRMLAHMTPDTLGAQLTARTHGARALEFVFAMDASNDTDEEQGPKRARLEPVVPPPSDVIDLSADPEIIDLTGDTEDEDADCTDTDSDGTVTCDEYDDDDEERDPDWLPSDEEAQETATV
jgi:hypothetical protein